MSIFYCNACRKQEDSDIVGFIDCRDGTATCSDAPIVEALKGPVGDLLQSAGDFGWCSDGTFTATFPSMHGARAMAHLFKVADESRSKTQKTT
jgi:hypothetical protein